MNINDKLENDILFSSIDQKGKEKLEQLHNYGIKTIKDFIEFNFETNITNLSLVKEYKAYQRVLRTKYLKEPLYVYISPDTEFYDSVEQTKTGRIIHNYSGYAEALSELGFDLRYAFISKSIASDNGKEKLINLLRKSVLKEENKKGDILAKFYIDYYDNGIKKVESRNEEIDELQQLKDELISLTNERNKIDERIAIITDKINSLEPKKDKNIKARRLLK